MRRIGAALDIEHISSGVYMTEGEALHMETILNSQPMKTPAVPINRDGEGVPPPRFKQRKKMAYLDGSMVNGGIGSIWCFALEEQSGQQLKEGDSGCRRNSFVRCLGLSRYGGHSSLIPQILFLQASPHF